MALFQRFQRNDQLIQVTQAVPAATAADESFIKLIVGLGNPGNKYDGTRHNIGFAVIDMFRENNDFPDWQEKSKFKAFVSEDFIAGKKIILAKPTTFMNDSGQAVRALKDFYRVDDKDIIVIHDELDLPFETVKQKLGGGSAGNNGIKSIIAHIGENFSRVRVGVRNDLLDTMDSADFVLAKFSKDEQKKLPEILEAAQKII